MPVGLLPGYGGTPLWQEKRSTGSSIVRSNGLWTLMVRGQHQTHATLGCQRTPASTELTSSDPMGNGGG